MLKQLPPSKLIGVKKFYSFIYVDFTNNVFLIFFNLGERFLFFTDFKNESKLPFLSTDLTPALETLSFNFLFKISLVNFTFYKLG